MEVHKNQQVVARGPKVALTRSGQAGLTAGTRGCHDEVALPPLGRRTGAGVVVLLLDSGIGTCCEFAGYRAAIRCLDKQDSHDSEFPARHPAVAGRAREACGPTAGLLPTGVAACCARQCGAVTVARRVRGSRCLGIRADHRERQDAWEHTRQRRCDGVHGRHHYRSAGGADRALSDCLASCALQPGIEHTAFRWFSRILRTSLLGRATHPRVACRHSNPDSRSGRCIRCAHCRVERPSVCPARTDRCSTLSTTPRLAARHATCACARRRMSFSRACLAKINAGRINPQFKRGISSRHAGYRHAIPFWSPL